MVAFSAFSEPNQMENGFNISSMEVDGNVTTVLLQAKLTRTDKYVKFMCFEIDF